MPLQNGSSAFAIELLQLPWRQVYDDDARGRVRPALRGDPGGRRWPMRSTSARLTAALRGER